MPRAKKYGTSCGQMILIQNELLLFVKAQKQLPTGMKAARFCLQTDKTAAWYP
jgi:hypothetical protein